MTNRIKHDGPRFTVLKSTQHGSRPVWFIADATKGSMPVYNYRLKQQAQVICDRWNADHKLAESEMPREFPAPTYNQPRA